MTTPDAVLTPTQRVVYDVLRHHPYGACRKVFADVDVYEVANRITEIEHRLGIVIDRGPCEAHEHRLHSGIVSYRLRSGHADRLFDLDGGSGV